MNERPSLSVSLAAPLEKEQAVQVAMAALGEAASKAGWTMRPSAEASAQHRIEVRLSAGADVRPMQPGTLPTVEEQSCRIRTRREGERNVTSLVADGVLGAAYGLIWLADRLRAGRGWPPEDADRRPRFAQRFGGFHLSFAPQEKPPYIDRENSEKQIEHAIRQLDHALLANATAILHYDVQNLIPWDDPKHGQRNAVCRELYAEFLKAAHARRLRIYPMGDEFLYLPEWFKRTGATLSTDDPKLWEALKSKYRGLLRAMPEIDGIATRVGEVIPKGDIMAWDIIHTGEDRSLEGNYRRFVKAMYEVVVGECGRQYFHRTWVVNTWEQSSVPEIYARTFTDEIPTKNLILCIKLTTGDQWEWQPINPTFGQTPHATAATVETARAQDYLSGSPDFAVEFAQAGLEWALEHGSVATMMNLRPLWQENLWAGMEYAAWRLAWNPYQPVREIVADWARATIGPQIAERVAEMLLDLDDIHREGFHVRGPSYHTWEPFRHARKGWICKGNPYLDGGRGQHRHLRDIYLMAKPELESGLRTMSEHTARYDRWLDSFRAWMRELDDPERGRWLETILARGQDYLHINLAYVTAFLRYFDYEDNRDGGRRESCVAAVRELEKELERFQSRSSEIVQGIEEFLKFARRGLEDIDALERAMARLPNEAEVERILREAQRRDAEAIERNPKARLYARWRGNIDGRDILRFAVNEGTWEIEHCLGDPASTYECTVGERPTGSGRFAARITLGEERCWAYILEQPGKENGETLPIMVEDTLPGQGAHDIGIYWLPA